MVGKREFYTEANEFGAYLRTIRLGLQFTLDEAAERIGSVKAHVWQLEKGRTSNPSINLLARIAKAYNRPLAEVCEVAARCCAIDPSPQENAQ